MTTRILYIADSLMAGGIESQLVELALGLDRSRFIPHILCLYGPHARDLHFAPALCAAGIPLYLPDLDWSARDKLRGINAIVQTVRAIQPHIIQAEGYHANLLMRLAVPLLAPWHARIIGSVRGVLTAKQMRYERLSHRLCLRLVTNAPHLKADLIERGHVPSAKVIYIPNGITPDRYAQPADASLRSRLAPQARRIFVSLGRISFEKNMHWIAQAFGLLKRQERLPEGVRLFIVGPQQDPAAQRLLDEAIQQDTLEQIVAQLPATPHPADFYHASDACILFSPNEGLPNVSLEALAAGRPVVISDAANAADIIRHGENGWVVPSGDIQALADTLSTILTLPDATLQAMRDACLRRAQDFTVEKLVARYTDLYAALTPNMPDAPSA